MTTEVKITVPESADYKVWMFGKRGNLMYCVQVFPSEKYTTHIHDGNKILGLVEVPVTQIMVNVELAYKKYFLS